MRFLNRAASLLWVPAWLVLPDFFFNDTATTEIYTPKSMPRLSGEAFLFVESAAFHAPRHRRSHDQRSMCSVMYWRIDC